MIRNHVEDALIDQIDKVRAGVDLERENNEIATVRQYKKFYIEWIDDTLFWANFLPVEMTDLEISMQAAALAFKVAAAKKKLDVLVAETGLSRRQLRHLPKTDERKLRFALYESHIYELEEQHNDLVWCVNARKFLKEQPGLIRMYIQFRFNRCTNRLDVVMDKLAAMFPVRRGSSV